MESIASAIRNEKGEVHKLVIVNRDVTERKRAEEQLKHNSFHDALTGLPNRRLFLDRLQQIFARAQRNPESHCAVLFVDLDGFKNVLKLRAEVEGQWGGYPPAPEKYYDSSYYFGALAKLKGAK